jgi:serine/threonine protein kinase
MARFLLEKGANIGICDKTGKDARGIAEHFKRGRVIHILGEYQKWKKNERTMQEEEKKRIQRKNATEQNMQEKNIIQIQEEETKSSIIEAKTSSSTLQINPISFQKLKFGNSIGRGGLGEVYRGDYDGEAVAIKKIPLKKEEIWKESSNEILFLLKTNHPRIIRCFGWSHDESNTYIVLELMKYSFDSLLWGDKKMKLTSQQKLQALRDIATGIEYLHKSKLIHRDLKSLNILLDNDLRAKVCDFGLMSQGTNSKTFHSSLQRRGTTLWMAPELFENFPTYSIYSDVYAFSIIIFETLEENYPWNNENEYTVPFNVIQGKRPTLSVKPPEKLLIGLEKLMENCWKQLPKERPTFDNIMIQLKDLEH